MQARNDVGDCGKMCPLTDIRKASGVVATLTMTPPCVTHLAFGPLLLYTYPQLLLPQVVSGSFDINSNFCQSFPQ
jgi:hypothetical protein